MASARALSPARASTSAATVPSSFLITLATHKHTDQESDDWIQGRMKGGGVGERSKPTVFKTWRPFYIEETSNREDMD